MKKLLLLSLVLGICQGAAATFVAREIVNGDVRYTGASKIDPKALLLGGGFGQYKQPFWHVSQITQLDDGNFVGFDEDFDLNGNLLGRRRDIHDIYDKGDSLGFEILETHYKIEHESVSSESRESSSDRIIIRPMFGGTRTPAQAEAHRKQQEKMRLAAIAKEREEFCKTPALAAKFPQLCQH